MDPVSTPSDLKGPLRYLVEASSPEIEAGKQFSVFVKISNPYDKPITIKSITTRLPFEFIDSQTEMLDQRRQAIEGRLNGLAKEMIADGIPNVQETRETRRQKTIEAAKDIFRVMPFGSLFTASYSLAQLVTAASLAPAERVLRHVEDDVRVEDVQKILEKVKADPNPSASFKQQTIDLLNQKLAALTTAPEDVLQPGDTIIRVFTLRTRHALLFSPSTYNLHIQTEHDCDGRRHQDTVDYRLFVRASIGSIISGAIIGSVIGYIIRDIFQEKGLLQLVSEFSTSRLIEWMIKLVGNCLLGVVLVVTFARKKDSQPIMTIEDFWGGVLIGVMAGYTGKSILDKYLVGATAKP